MCGFQDTLSNIIPIDWLDPYGRTPFAKDAELSVDITIVETDDGIRAKSIKNPPTTGGDRLMNAIKNALGVGFDICDPLCSPMQSVDQGKCDTKKHDDQSHFSSTKETGNDTMNPSSSGDSRDRDRNPGSQRSPILSRQGATEDKDEEKAPRFK